MGREHFNGAQFAFLREPVHGMASAMYMPINSLFHIAPKLDVVEGLMDGLSE